MGLLTKRGDMHPSVFGNLFDDFFKDEMAMPSYLGNSIPAVNISEQKDKFKIDVAVPGMEKQDFKLNLDHNVLTISCEKRTEEEKKEESYTRREFSFNSFQRSFTLPESVDVEKIDATYKDGLLTIALFKKAESKKAMVKDIKVV